MRIIDTNHDMTGQLDALTEAVGVGGTVIRYINPLSTGGEKTVKAPEARALAGVGVRLGLVCEGWGNFAHNAITALTGSHDGGFCRRYAAEVLGAPKEACIYYAVDNDATAGQMREAVLPYFEAIRQAMADATGLPSYRVGVYGSGAVCAAVLDAGYADLAWLAGSTGWRGFDAFKDSKRWALLQQGTEVAASLGADSDTGGTSADIGDWLPTSVPAVATHDTKWLQATLNTLGSDPALTIDGIPGPRTRAAIKAFQASHGLVVDGIAGDATISAIEAALTARPG